MERINAAILAILESRLAWLSYYLIRDRDHLTDDEIAAYESRSDGRIAVLTRHEIENYLIDDELIARVHSAMSSTEVDAGAVRESMLSIAREISTDQLRDMVTYRLNRLIRPQDFSIGRFMTDQPVVDGSGGWDETRFGQLKDALLEKAEAVIASLGSVSDRDAVATLIDDCRAMVDSALTGDGWRKSFPGKELLRKYATRNGLGKEPAFENALIRAFGDEPDRIPEELRNLVSVIAAGEPVHSTTATS